MLLGGGQMSVALRTAGGDPACLALNWLDRDRSAKLLVDSSLRIRWANSAANAWLLDHRPLGSVEGRLCAGRFASELRALLERSASEPEALCLPIDGEEFKLILFAHLVATSDEELIYGVTARRTNELDWNRPVGVDQAFGLTATETKVLQLLWSGATAGAAAECMNVSIETIRTHIRRLYAKMGVGSREALFTRLSPFMIAA